MSNLKHKAMQCSTTIPESLFIRPSSYNNGRPLPFRSRDATSNYNSPTTNDRIMKPQEDHHVKRVQEIEPINGNKELNPQFYPSRGIINSSANKENVKSWLDSASPTPVLKISQQRGHLEMDPPTPSPICSPSRSSPISSPRPSLLKPNTEASLPEIVQPNIPSNNLTNPNDLEVQASGSKREESSSTSKRHGKDIAFEAPPDSPTGSSISSGSEGGLLALLASKLLSYREHGRLNSRYARERSGPIDDKHVMEDRGRKPPVEEIHTVQAHAQTEPMNGNGLHRTASEAASELSLGSANDRTLSMEFDAMLAAAVATRGQQAANTPSGLEDSRDHHHNEQLPEIQEDNSLRNSSFAADQYNDPNFRALVRVGDSRPVSSDDEASRTTNGLTVMRQGRETNEMDFNSTTSEMLLLSPSSSRGSRRAESEENNNMQIVPTTFMRSQSPDAGYAMNNNNNNNIGPSCSASSCGSNGDTPAMSQGADQNSRSTPPSMLSSSASSSINKKNMPPITNSARQALEKLRRDKVFAQALAYQDAKNAQHNNRYRREECKINAWENQQRIKASMGMKKVEMKLEQKRAKAFEKMQNEIALAHKRAEQRKASAEAVRAAKTTKVAEVSDNIRRSGKVPSGCLPF